MVNYGRTGEAIQALQILYHTILKFVIHEKMRKKKTRNKKKNKIQI